GGGRRIGLRAPAAGAARARASRACPTRCGVRAAGGGGLGHTRRRDCAQGAADASADRPGRARRAARRRAAGAGGRRVTTPVAIAVDGGNSKTDLALIDADGEVLALLRGDASSPQHLQVDGSVELLDELRREALDRAGLAAGSASAAALFMAGVDFPSERAELEQAVRARRWAPSVVVENDTFAVLRAGTERGWGVAVTCGAGINCVGVSPAGRVARFPALGAITGDWGGGYDVGL